MTPEQQLAAFVAKFTPEVAAQTKKMRAKMRKLLPGAMEMVYDNYNALAIGYGPNERASEAVLSLAVFPKWVTLFFLHGATLKDPERLLKGKGNLVRHIRLSAPDDLEKKEIRALIDQAVAASTNAIPAKGGRLVIKSISAKQRPRRPAK